MSFLLRNGAGALGMYNVHTQWGALGRKNSSLWERILGVEDVITGGLSSCSQLFFIVALIAVWIFGTNIIPVAGTPEDFVMNFAPPWILTMVGLGWMGEDSDPPIVNDARHLVASPVIIRATWRGILNSPNQKFDVTDKGNLRQRDIFHSGVARLPLTLLVLTVGGMVIGTANAVANDMEHTLPLLFFWTAYNIAVLYVAVASCMEPAQRRADERFVADEHVTIGVGSEAKTARLTSISTTGVGVRASFRLVVGESVEVGIQGLPLLRGQVTRQTEGGFGVMFEHDDASRATLIDHVYSLAVTACNGVQYSSW